MNQDWSIQTRSESCSLTGTPFVPGEYFYTLLFDEKPAMRRQDLCEQAYKDRPGDAPRPFSQWRSKFEPAPPKAPEPLAKQTAEDLLRAYMADPNPNLANVRYILALMLERKRQFKEIEVRKSEDGSLLRIYQHGKSGEVFVIPDPGLRLSQVAAVQEEVAHLLSASPASPPTPSAENSTAGQTAPETQPESISTVLESIPVDQTSEQPQEPADQNTPSADPGPPDAEADSAASE
jgi:hypothetical protein